jgi:hypothetical protein
MAKKSMITVASVATLILPLSAFAQGSAGTGSTSTGIGERPGPRDLEYEATAGLSNPGQRRTQLQPEATISLKLNPAFLYIRSLLDRDHLALHLRARRPSPSRLWCAGYLVRRTT